MNNETTSQPPQKHTCSKRSWGNRDDNTSLFTSILCSRQILTFKDFFFVCVCVCSKKNNVTFFSPRFFFIFIISFLLWKSKVGSAEVGFLPQSVPRGFSGGWKHSWVLPSWGVLPGWPWGWKGGCAQSQGQGLLWPHSVSLLVTSAFGSAFSGAALWSGPSCPGPWKVGCSSWSHCSAGRPRVLLGLSLMKPFH